jgi:fission process protein 1
MTAHKPAADASDSVDPFRDTWLRYLGYANEVGEAFRYVLPSLVAPSYFVSIGYVLGDVLDKGLKEHGKSKDIKRAMVLSFDCLMWQSLASVVLPGLVIHKVVGTVSKGVSAVASGREVLRAGPIALPTKALPVLVGLACIPLVIEPIDHAVTLAMDASVRKLWAERQLNVQGLT